MSKRFKESGLTIGLPEVQELVMLMEEVPNSIQELCQMLAFTRSHKKIMSNDIRVCIEEILDLKGSRYLERLVNMTEKEKKILAGIAKCDALANVTSADFIKATGVSPSGIKSAVKRFYDYGLIDLGPRGYQLVDPLFKLFLAKNL